MHPSLNRKAMFSTQMKEPSADVGVSQHELAVHCHPWQILPTLVVPLRLSVGAVRRRSCCALCESVRVTAARMQWWSSSYSHGRASHAAWLTDCTRISQALSTNTACPPAAAAPSMRSESGTARSTEDAHDSHTHKQINPTWVVI